MDNAALRPRIIATIDAYLQGAKSGNAAAAWAAEALGSHSFDSSEVVLDEALCAIAGLGHEDPNLDTSHDELRTLRAALLGNADYVVALTWGRASHPR